MEIERLETVQFKNHHNRNIAFRSGINLITGINGCGKTNLLDAIWFLASSKSFFNLPDANLIEHGFDFFRIKGHFQSGPTAIEVVCKYSKSEKKEISVQNRPLKRFSEILGQIPLVMISPYDQALLQDGSESRRNFMDAVLSTVSNEYFRYLKSYNRTLEQRNELLRQSALTGRLDLELLDNYDLSLAQLAMPIYEFRKQAVTSWIPAFQKYYRCISEDREEVQIVYKSRLSEGRFLQELKNQRSKDEILKRTTIGIHKDDIDFDMVWDEKTTMPLKRVASQGQQKTLLLALKFSIFSYLSGNLNKKPILLMDDVFDKLDEKRSSLLIQVLKNNEFGQIIIADTNEQRIKADFSTINAIRIS